MRDYRVPKAVWGFNPQKLYTEILKSESTERWCREDYGVMTLISNYVALYIVPGKYPLADGLIAGANLRALIPDWDNGEWSLPDFAHLCKYFKATDEDIVSMVRSYQ